MPNLNYMLMEEILHQSISSLSHSSLTGFSTSQVVSRMCSINRIITSLHTIEHDPIEKEHNLQNLHFKGSMLVFRGVDAFISSFWFHIWSAPRISTGFLGDKNEKTPREPHQLLDHNPATKGEVGQKKCIQQNVVYNKHPWNNVMDV